MEKFKRFLTDVFKHTTEIKKCRIFKTEKNYKIETLYCRRRSGIYTVKEPVFILPLKIEANEFCKFVFESLGRSGNIGEGNSQGTTKDYLKLIKEKSLKKLYGTSNVCEVSLDGDAVVIAPYKKINRWIGQVDEDVIKLEYRKDQEVEIGQTILDVLEISYR